MSLGIWACGWSREQHVEQHRYSGEPAASQLRALQGDAVSWEQQQTELEEWQTKGRAFSQTQSLRWLFHFSSAQQKCGELSRAVCPEVLSEECHSLGVPKERLSPTLCHGLGCCEPKVPRSACHHRFSVPPGLLWGLRACRKNWCKMLWRC